MDGLENTPRESGAQADPRRTCRVSQQSGSFYNLLFFCKPSKQIRFQWCVAMHISKNGFKKRRRKERRKCIFITEFIKNGSLRAQETRRVYQIVPKYGDKERQREREREIERERKREKQEEKEREREREGNTNYAAQQPSVYVYRFSGKSVLQLLSIINYYYYHYRFTITRTIIINAANNIIFIITVTIIAINIIV